VPTRPRHLEKSSLKEQHLKACAKHRVERLWLYTLRHTCLTRWAKTAAPHTPDYLSGHGDFATTKRYVHPQAEAVREAILKAVRRPAAEAACARRSQSSR
jgi:integrase